MKINDATIYIDGLDLSFKGPLNSKAMISLNNPSSTQTIKLTSSDRLPSVYMHDLDTDK